MEHVNLIKYTAELKVIQNPENVSLARDMFVLVQ
jgi:hypothetical protein